MLIQKLVGPKEMLLNLWLDLDRCIQKSAYVFDDELTEVEELVVILEDKRYFTHLGIDYKSIARVLIQQVSGTRRGGASTIEMQFVRTVTGRYERTLRRKIREIFLSRLLCFHRSKLEILRGYLAIAYFGRRTVGVEGAAYRMFGKPSSELSGNDAATIAACLVYPAPEITKNSRWLTKVQNRAQYGLKLLAAAEKR